jgi:inner membrane protein
LFRQGAGFAAIGTAPDLDLLVGLHSMYTHSVAAVVLVGVLAWFLRRGRAARWAVASAAALASHILLDWLGSDTTAPIGIMALWPFSSCFYQSPFFVFPAVSRRFGEWSFVVQNAKALMWEVVILVPITAAVGWARRERDERRAEALPHMRAPG